jgi:hypothetical protein
MPRTLYSPRLSDDVVRALYREGQRRRMPMTRLADDLLRQSLGSFTRNSPVLHVRDDAPVVIPTGGTDARPGIGLVLS